MTNKKRNVMPTLPQLVLVIVIMLFAVALSGCYDEEVNPEGGMVCTGKGQAFKIYRGANSRLYFVRYKEGDSTCRGS